MKKVAVVSCYFKHNYGSMLQAYATQKILDNMGLENETINIDENKDFANGKKKYYMSQILNFSFIKSKLGMIKLKLDKKINKKLGKNIAIRDKKYKEFEKNFNLTRPYITYQELTEACNEKYSSVIVGSDQLWLPVNVVADYYTLNWVPDNVNKISYATSFGISKVPDKYKELYKKYLERINNLSTRENAGVNIIKEITGRNAELVCDPTLLFNKEEWMTIQKKDRIYEDKYIFCYFLGKNIEHRKFVERLKAKTGYKIVSLNHCDEYVKYSDKFADYAPYDVGPSEFLNLIRNAEYVCTDSFHGTVFSLINNVKFFTFERYKNKNSKVSTNSRIYSLLGLMNLQNRILKGNENVEEVANQQIDFDNVNEKLEEFRKNSKQFFTDALSESIEIQKKNNKKKYIEIYDKSECCGCTACASVCPKNAITMKEDEEGFLYPTIDKEKCINCGLCKKVCPIMNKKIEKKEQTGYVLNHKDLNVRENSTSGGAFTPIAEFVLEKNGAVFGASFDKNYNVIHEYIEDKKDLQRFRGSKYVQSELRDSFKKTKEFLDNNRYVCFSGTPCQIEGLKKFLQRDYENLITVDVMCHAVPSPLVWKKYREYIQRNKLKGEKLKKIMFRDKSRYGFKYSMMTLESEHYKYSRGVETDPYLRAFFGDLSDRPSCYNCAFKKPYHESDFTIWDCFVAENFDKKLDDDKGTSRVLINSKKGRKIFEDIKDKFNYKEVEVEELVKNVKEMLNSVNYSEKRKEFFYDINRMEEERFFNKFFKDNIKVKLERSLRIFLAKTGLYKKIKRIAKKIIRR